MKLMQSAVLKMELTSLNIRWVPIPLTVPRCITLVFSHLRLVFQDPVSKTEYCKITLDDANLKAFLYAVKNHYWYQMYLGTKNVSFFIASEKTVFLRLSLFIIFGTLPCADDLPIWGIVGEIDEKEDAFYIWTHKKFEIGYNRDQVRIISYAVRHLPVLL
jgi:transmembrane 9 superfamily protein 3